MISDPLTDTNTRLHRGMLTSNNFEFFLSTTKLTINRIRRNASHAYVVGNLHIVNNGCRIVTHSSNNMLQIAQDNNEARGIKRKE